MLEGTWEALQVAMGGRVPWPAVGGVGGRLLNQTVFNGIVDGVQLDLTSPADTDHPTLSTDIVLSDDWIGIRDPAHSPQYHRIKRLVDLTLATLCLLALIPVFAVVWLAIRLDSPGPAVFRQERVGSRRIRVESHTIWQIRTFTFYKFRTMHASTSQDLHRDYSVRFIEAPETVHRRGAGPGFKPPDQVHVTRVGRVLRRLSIDELPQLWNVVKGEMSLVGPRPAMVYEVARYRPNQLNRLSALPGMTGWAQVNGRSNRTFEEIVALDIEYMGLRSMLADLRILTKTAGVVLSGEGAG